MYLTCTNIYCLYLSNLFWSHPRTALIHHHSPNYSFLSFPLLFLTLLATKLLLSREILRTYLPTFFTLPEFLPLPRKHRDQTQRVPSQSRRRTKEGRASNHGEPPRPTSPPGSTPDRPSSDPYNILLLLATTTTTTTPPVLPPKTTNLLNLTTTRRRLPINALLLNTILPLLPVHDAAAGRGGPLQPLEHRPLRL